MSVTNPSRECLVCIFWVAVMCVRCVASNCLLTVFSYLFWLPRDIFQLFIIILGFSNGCYIFPSVVTILISVVDVTVDRCVFK